jgi:phosphatidylglycerol lysyltransferase
VIASLRHRPVTIVYFAVTLVAGILTGFLSGPSRAVRELFGNGFEPVVEAGHWWAPLTSAFLADRGVLPIALVTIVAGIGSAERLMGSRRLLVAVIGSAVIGTAAGISAQAVGVAHGEAWSRDVRELTVVDPFLFVVGAVMAASGFCRPLWRRRLRVFVLSACVVFLLYSGQPSDLYRIVAALAGLVLGRWLRPRRTHADWFRSTHHEARVLLAAVVATMAVGPVITIFSGRRFGLLGPLGLLLSEAAPDGSRVFERCQAVAATSGCMREMTLERLNSVGPVLLTLLPLVALLVAALGLARGRRLALWLAVGVNVAIAALGCYYYGLLPYLGRPDVLAPHPRPTWEVTLSVSASILVPLLVSALLVRNLHHFTVRATPRRVRNYLRAMSIALVGLSALYVGIGWMLRAAFQPRVRFIDLLSDLPERFVPVGFLHLEALHFLPISPATRVLYDWTGPAFWIVVVLGALYTYFDAGTGNYVAGLPAVRGLRFAGGGGSLGAWATWKGNSYWFTPDGRASVAYRVVNGIAITTSEPIGDERSATAAIAEFARFCDDRGWTPVFYAVHDMYRATFSAMGWRTMVVGEETVIRPGLWQTSGKRWQDIRSSINRAERQGITAQWTTFDALTLAQVDQLHDMSEQWVSEKGLPEMGFTLGGIDELRDADTELMIAVDTDDRLVGITSWMPSYRAGKVTGWTLDFMRRAPESMNGVMEFLIARSAERFAAEGAEFMSLSTAPLAQSETDAGQTGRVLAWIAAALEPVYGFRSLFQFKRKFQPELHPVLMAYPDALVLPALGVALARAYLPSMSVRQSLRFMRDVVG